MTGSESKITRFKNAQFSRFILNSPLSKLVMRDIVRRKDNECKPASEDFLPKAGYSSVFAESTFPVFKFMMPRMKCLGLIANPGRSAVMIAREKVGWDPLLLTQNHS